MFVVKSTFASFKPIPFALIIRTSLVFKPLSYLNPTLIDLILNLVPSKRLNVYLSLISSKLKLLEFDRLYLNEGPPKTLIGPKTL